MTYCIYVVTNITNNKTYVGQTCQTLSTRWVQHLSAAKNGSDNYFYRAIRKYGPENFTKTVVQDGLNAKQANQEEIKWIAKLNSTDSKNGYNGTFGGNSSIPTELTKQKLSETRKELFKDPDFKQRMAEANTGKHHTEEGRANIAKGLIGNQYRTGIPHSDDIKEQISSSMKLAYAEGRHRKTEGLKKGTKLGPMPEERKQRIAETMRQVRKDNPWSTSKNKQSTGE